MARNAKSKKREPKALSAGKKHTESESPEENKEIEFEVQTILEHRVKNKKYSFKVRWVGFPKSGFEDTYEPLENLDGAESCLRQYFAKQKLGLALEKDKETGVLKVVQHFKRAQSAAAEETPGRNRDASVGLRKARHSSLKPASMNAGRGKKTGKTSTDNQKPMETEDVPAVFSKLKNREKPRTKNPWRKGEKGNVFERDHTESIAKDLMQKIHNGNRGSEEISEMNGHGHIQAEPKVEDEESPMKMAMNKAKKRKNSEERDQEDDDSHGSESSDQESQFESYNFENPKLLHRKGGFDNGWSPEKIVAIVKQRGNKKHKKNIEYVVQFKETKICEPVPGKVLLRQVPEMLVQFLESCITWDTDD